MDQKAVIGAETIFQIGKVRTWRTVLKRKQVWKTARYTKGDIEALIVGIEDKEGNIGYGYVPAMFLEGESAPSAEAILHVVLRKILLGREYPGDPDGDEGNRVVALPQPPDQVRRRRGHCSISRPRN